MQQSTEWYVAHAKTFRASTLAEKLGITVEQARKLKAGTATLADFQATAPTIESEDADVSDE